MVSLPHVLSSNAVVSSALPQNPIAVFVGATSGIGLTTLLAFVKHTTALQPRIYIVGRNHSAATLIIAQCKTINPSGEFVFLKADISLMKTVDEVCDEIKKREKTLNILFISAGAADLDRSLTTEGLHTFTAVLLYARIRFISALIPLIRIAPSLRRVVIVGGGTCEGPLYPDDFQAINVPLLGLRGHLCTLNTLAMEVLAKDAPEVGFVSDFPGAVDTPFSSHIKGVMGVLLRTYFRLFGWLICVPIEECGERHVYFLTSARYPAAEANEVHDGVVIENETEVARGSDGEVGSGVYSIGWDGESASPKVWKLLAGYRQKGMLERISAHLESEFSRIAG